MRNPQNDPAAVEAVRRATSAVPNAPASSPAARATKDELIRLALGPDGEVAPDVRARAPGRGAWIGVGRAELDAANAKGKLKAALQRAFKTNDVTVPADLGERTEARAAPGERSTGSAWKRAPATSSAAPTGSRPPPAPARSTC